MNLNKQLKIQNYDVQVLSQNNTDVEFGIYVENGVKRIPRDFRKSNEFPRFVRREEHPKRMRGRSRVYVFHRDALQGTENRFVQP